MTEHEKTGGHFFTGLLIGGTLGALIGILFAPKSGKELRFEIQEKGEAVLKGAKDIYDNTTTKASQIVVEAEHQATELKKDVDRHLSETRRNMKEILVHDENKQAEAGVTEN